MAELPCVRDIDTFSARVDFLTVLRQIVTEEDTGA